jgi:hypothetical protein
MAVYTELNNIQESREKIKVWFFAGAETRDDKFNVFTGSFIRLMREIFGNEFGLITGVFYSTNMRNVAWALNNSQKPFSFPDGNKFVSNAVKQIVKNGYTPDTRLILVSSSAGSVMAAQTACYLAEMNSGKLFFRKPVHIALGASMVSVKSQLFRKLVELQEEEQVGSLIHDDLQDDGDSSTGAGSTSRFRAWMNAIGLMLPWISWKHSGPSFLNIHPVNGHIHRRRSQTIHKALDFINVLLVKHNLAGEHYRQRALNVLERESTF